MSYTEFLMSQLFTVYHGKRLTKNKRIKGEIPFLTAGEQNCGVAEYISNTECGLYNNAITIDMFGNCFYHKGLYSGDDNIYFFINENISELSKLYIVSSLKHLTEAYSYGKQFRQSDANTVKVKLPSKTILIPDFEELAMSISGGGTDMNNIDTSNWKDFRLEDLFDSINGDYDLQQKHINGKGIPVISSGESNFGVIGKTDIKAKVIPENTITVDMFGNVYFRNYEYKIVTHARVFALQPKETVSIEIGLFLAASLKHLKEMYSYNNMCSWNKIKNQTIKLPAKELTVPDWEYMETYIAELEQERVAELDAYLKATGLDDYELTDEEKEILSSAINGGANSQNSISGNYSWKLVGEFKLNKLFDIYGTKSLDAGTLVFQNIGINFIGRRNDNNGCQGKIPKQSFEPNEANTITATVIGNYKYVKFQEEPYYCSQNVNKLVLKDCFNYQLNSLSAQYFITLIDKFTSQYNGQQGGYKLNQLKEFVVSLPVDSNGNPDFAFMETYITATQKLVIKYVIDYKNKIIEETRKIIKK